LRTRELEMQANQAEWEAARQASLQDAQVQLQMESRKQEAQARKAEAAQMREQNKQAFELQMNKWSIDKMRGLVSLLLVVGFLATTGIVILLNATGQAPLDMLQTVSSLYSGITGAVLGFYFGRQQQ
jgi:Fe2+ transport system protein B